MTRYYAEKLAGVRLRRCYELASPRVQRYLGAEIEHVKSSLRPADTVLELGCGYGRVLFPLASVTHLAVGIDNAWSSLTLASQIAGPAANARFCCMDALALGFRDGSFDAVVCIQNGICAFGEDPERLLREALRVTRPGGLLLVSSYAECFWPERLRWFEAQAEEGLLAPIDYAASCDGVIACTDGFRAGRLTAAGFRSLCGRLNLDPRIEEVDGSSLFCAVVKPDLRREETESNSTG